MKVIPDVNRHYQYCPPLSSRLTCLEAGPAWTARDPGGYLLGYRISFRFSSFSTNSARSASATLVIVFP